VNWLSESSFIGEWKNFVESSAGFGFSERDSSVYLTLLVNGEMKAGDLAKQLKLHRLDVYNSLKHLQHEGLVETTLSKPMKFRAAPLDTLLEIIRERDEQVQRERLASLSQLENSSKALKKFLSSRVPNLDEKGSDSIQIMSGKKIIRERWSKLVASATREILIVATEKGTAHTLLSGVLDTIARKVRSGVRARIFTPVNSQNVEQFRELQKEIRHLSSYISGGMCVIDGKQALIVVEPTQSVSPDRRETNAIITDSNSIVQILRTLFFVGWDTSPSVKEAMAGIVR
jgi:sugar-specific transcriptional regulator TrmB